MHPRAIQPNRAGSGGAWEAAIETTHDTRRNVSLRLTILARMMRNNFDRMVAGLNVTRSQWALIAVVSTHAGATQRMIAEMLEMSEASAGRLIDRLCADGLLERRERDNDRRARAVYITPAAEPLLNQLAELAKTGEEQFFKGFTQDELEQLQKYLERLYDNASRY